ncbi:MAG: hypothetical protein LBV49_04215 [Azonexus sp.]|jgi:hypothetical protein|nr:hypothetical protein [Azonexus sp.]
MIEIANDGPNIVHTNFWSFDFARRGVCYLSYNAKVWRLLVPSGAEFWLTEMRTGNHVTIEPSKLEPNRGKIDVVFEDGSVSPFCLSLDPLIQVDRLLTPDHECQLAVWTESGRQMLLPCDVKVET